MEKSSGKVFASVSNENYYISGLAATYLGHIARIHGQLDKGIVIAALKENMKNKEIKGRIEDALDDIKMYLK